MKVDFSGLAFRNNGSMADSQLCPHVRVCFYSLNVACFSVRAIIITRTEEALDDVVQDRRPSIRRSDRTSRVWHALVGVF